MPKFSYTAKTQDAKTVKEVEDAGSREELISKLRARGLFIVSVSEVKAGGGSAFSLSSLPFVSRGKRSSIKLFDLASFARNLATTLSSGVTLLRSLEILASQTESAKLEKILKNCGQNVRDGLSLNEAISKYPAIFSPMWQGVIEVGESSGNLPFVLEKLADYLEMRMEFERKIKSAMIYPTILFIVATAAVFFFFKFIMPKFSSLFDQFDIELPGPTKVIFGISKAMEHHFLLILLIIGAIGVGAYYFVRNPTTRKIWDELQLRLPLLGKIAFLSCLERLTSTIYILLDSGLPLVYTLDVASRGVGNSYLEKHLISVKDKVKDGASLSREFARLNIFPLLVSEMAKIGEETGSMPQIFKKISEHYQKDLTTRVERLIAAFEPIMIVFMGIIIGGIVLSLFLPLFKIATLGGG